MSGEILEIHIAPTAGASMQSIPTADLEADKGIVGDRYYVQSGTFSEKLIAKGDADWHVTLIETEEIDKFNKTMELSFSYGDFRRNIITRGIELNALVGTQFKVGEVLLEGVRLCEPCAHLASLLAEQILPAMVGRGGLRARIIEGGKVSTGDNIIK